MNKGLLNHLRKKNEER
jgi:hypothetical protein